MAVIHVTTAEFENVVLKSDKPVAVDFWATWCGPCRMLTPIIEAAAQRHPEIVFAKVNVDEEPELAMRYGISAIPAVYLFRNGTVANRNIGYCDENDFEDFLG